MKKKYLFVICFVIFIIGMGAGAVGYFLYIEGIDNAYEAKLRELHFEGSLQLYWALENDKTELAKKIIAQDIEITKRKILEKDKKDAIIPHCLDSLIEISKTYEYIGTFYSTECNGANIDE